LTVAVGVAGAAGIGVLIGPCFCSHPAGIGRFSDVVRESASWPSSTSLSASSGRSMNLPYAARFEQSFESADGSRTARRGGQIQRGNHPGGLQRQALRSADRGRDHYGS